jgi:hypothetical protein
VKTSAESLCVADVAIVGATPAGIMAAVAAARLGRRVVLLERTGHIGGLCASGLGATDIQTRGATAGLFLEFVRRVRQHYVTAYGIDSAEVRDCSEGYHFEPAVAEHVLEGLLAEHPNIEVRRLRQFDADPANAIVVNGRLHEIAAVRRDTGGREHYRAGVFIDATYEGDLAAAAGGRYRLGREDARDFAEPMAGVIYKGWRRPPGPGSTGRGDNAIQAYNYRLCLTREPAQRVLIPRPTAYRRDEYASLVDDVVAGRWTGPFNREQEGDGIGRVVNLVTLPRGKTDANNQHLGFLSTDLPEENWPWPTASWAWRDAFAARLRDYTLGLLWFCQHDEALPADFRARCAEWGLAADEYADNGHFPRQVYVREARRIEGRYLFTAHDALPVSPGGRPPLHADSVTASHYPLDSHAVRKREPGRDHLDGFFSLMSAPYTVPFGVMVPREMEGLLVPVACSATHVGLSTLRMEPCWMALGEAAGTAAVLALTAGVPVARVSIESLQAELLARGAVLVYFRDAAPGDSGWVGLQRLALRGAVAGWDAELGAIIDAATASCWCDALGVTAIAPRPGEKRGAFLARLAPHASPGLAHP